jgi:proteasome assembly chaperone (PAC2) family protein
MEDLRVYKKIALNDPVMIAGWPGMGSVALGVVNYMRRKLSASKFAEIKMDRFATLDSVVVEDGLAALPKGPHNIFYYTKNPDMIIFEGEVQAPGVDGIKLVNKVLDLAASYGVKRIYSGAAFPMPVTHRDQTELYAAANHKALLGGLSVFGIKPMDGGHISGLNGLIIGFARERGIEAISILATMPQYAISLPNPRASGAVIEALSKMLNFKIDMHELDEYIKDIDEKMTLIEDKVKDVLTIEHDEPESYPVDKKIPEYIMEKIEKLFRDAKSDKAKASDLKRELDRWDLYHLYEDRFLDLFRER